MMRLIKGLNPGKLTLILVGVCSLLGELCMPVEILFDPQKTYTNTITQSVGPTTSTTSRSLVDSDTTHYIYLDATNGNDGNSGFAPNLAKATLGSAYSAMTGVRYVIHILDSSEYRFAGFANFIFNSVNSSGIQAELGQTPSIVTTPGEATAITLEDNGGGKFISGITLKMYPNLYNAIINIVQKGTVTITDNYIYNYQAEAVSNLTVYTKPHCILSDLGTTGNCYIKNNVIINDAPYAPIYIGSTTGTVSIDKNIIYQNGALVNDEKRYNIEAVTYLGTSPTLVVDFDQPTLTAIIDGTSGVASLTPNAWVGYFLSFGFPFYYKIIGNTSNTFYLEDTFNSLVGTVANISVNIYYYRPDAGIIIQPSATAANLSSSVTQNIVIGKSHNAGIMNIANVTVLSNAMTAEGNVILNTSKGIMLSKYAVKSVLNIGTISANENIFYSSIESDITNLGGDTITPDAGMTLASSSYSNKITPLYFNQQAALTPVTSAPFVDATLGYVKCAYDFRLRQKGKKYYTTDTQIMLVDSMLLDLYTTPNPDEDLNPWEETLTESAITYAGTVSLTYPATSIQITYKPTNPVEVYDLHGNLKIDWDSWRKEFKFSFDQTTYLNNEQIWSIYRLLESKKVKKLYPLGNGNTLIPDDTDGDLTNTTYPRAVFSASPAIPFSIHHWKGFWLTLIDTLGSYDYYIEDNDYSAFTLIDKLGLGFPGDGNYYFNVQYILVQNLPTEYTFGQQNFTNFAKGGAWREKTDSAEHEFTGLTLTFVEAENPV